MRRFFFTMATMGKTAAVALRDFGDFLVWNRDDIPAYELAVVVDDLAMGITEVVRGADLLTSTARQLLLYRALGGKPPAFFHCDLLVDAQGRRLAKRDHALTIRTLREQGWTAERVSGRGQKRAASARNKFTTSVRRNGGPLPPHWPGC